MEKMAASTSAVNTTKKGITENVGEKTFPGKKSSTNDNDEDIVERRRKILRKIRYCRKYNKEELDAFQKHYVCRNIKKCLYLIHIDVESLNSTINIMYKNHKEKKKLIPHLLRLKQYIKYMNYFQNLMFEILNM